MLLFNQYIIKLAKKKRNYRKMANLSMRPNISYTNLSLRVLHWSYAAYSELADQSYLDRYGSTNQSKQLWTRPNQRCDGGH